jgi:centromere protein C
MASEASPNRAASQPPANRVLNFGRQGARMSVDNGSPFKPKRVLRRSFGGPRKDQIEETSERPTMDTEIAEEDEEDVEESEAKAGADAEAGSDEPQPLQNDQPDEPSSDDDAPPMFDNNEDFYDAQRESDDAEINEALQHAETLLQTTPTTTPVTAKARGRPRKSDQTTISQHTPQTAQTTSSSRKRDRTEMEEEEDVSTDEEDVENQTLQSIEQSQNEVPHISGTSENAVKRKRGRPRKSDNNENSQVSVTSDNAAKRRPGRPRKSDISVLQDPVDTDQPIQGVERDENDASQVSAVAESPLRKRPGRPRKSDVTVVEDDGEQTVDPADLAHGDSYLAPINEDDEVEVEAAPASPVTKKKRGRKPKAQKATKSQNAPKERDPNQSMRRTPSGSPGKVNGRDLALSRSPSKRAGSVSNVNLRASTPFEDAHQRMSRSGRPILAPLKHWAGESYVWKNGEVEGIIRADEVKTPKGDKKKKAKGRRRAPRAGGRGTSNGLDNIAEESDTESTVPDEWEDQVGVIAGTVAAWDPDLQQGVPEDPIREGMFVNGFAA